MSLTTLEYESQSQFPLARLLSGAGALVFGAVAFIPASTFERLLSRGSGQSATLIIPYLPRLCLTAAIAASLVCFLTWCQGKRLDRTFFRFVEWLSRPSSESSVDHARRSEQWRWIAICVALVMIFDWPSIFWGYFESDDFDFLIANRKLHWTELPFANLNDHVFPLVRLEIRGMHWLFGSFAPAYSLVAMASLAAMMAAGCLLLIELQLSRLSILIFCTSCIGWTMWGEFTSGEYILLAYQPLMTLAMVTAWSALRYQAVPSRKYLGIMMLAVLLACFSNVSGFWVAAAGLVFIFCGTWFGQPPTPVQSRVNIFTPQLIAVLIPAALAFVFCLYAYSRPESTGFLSSGRNAKTVAGVALQISYFLSSAMLSLFIPIPHHLVDFGMMEVAMGLSFLLASIGVIIVLRTSSKQVQAVVTSTVLTLLGIALMVSLGRPERGLGYYVPPKYLFLGYVWFCLIFALFVESVWQWSSHRHKLLAAKILLFAVGCSWLSHTFASTLGGLGLPFFEITRGGEWREHVRERTAYMKLRDDLFAPLEAMASGPIHLPDLPGHILCQRFPAIRYPWGAEPQLSIPIDVLTKHPQRFHFYWPRTMPYPPEPTEAPIRDVVSGEFFNLLKNSPAVQSLYFDPFQLPVIPLTPATITSNSPFSGWSSVNAVNEKRDRQIWAIESSGSTAMSVDANTWLPEQYPFLAIRIDQTKGKATALKLRFQSDLSSAPVEYSFNTDAISGAAGQIDLLAIPAYGLSHEIRDLRILFDHPGAYEISLLRLDGAEAK